MKSAYFLDIVLTAVGVAISECEHEYIDIRLLPIERQPNSLSVILFVRTWALYDRSMKLLYAFSALWIVSPLSTIPSTLAAAPSPLSSHTSYFALCMQAGFAVVCWAVGTFVKSIVCACSASFMTRGIQI